MQVSTGRSPCSVALTVALQEQIDATGLLDPVHIMSGVGWGVEKSTTQERGTGGDAHEAVTCQVGSLLRRPPSRQQVEEPNRLGSHCAWEHKGD
eukprot:383307-Prymnesium_polylepis.2